MLELSSIYRFINIIATSIYNVVFNELQYLFDYEFDLRPSYEQMSFIIMFFTMFVYVMLSIFVLWLFYKVIVGFIRLFV